MSEALKPCPWCHAPGESIDLNIVAGAMPTIMRHSMFCTRCNAEGPLAYSEERARAAWNARAPSADKQAAGVEGRRRYDFFRIVGSTVMAEGIGVHATSMDDAFERARKLADKGDTIAFKGYGRCAKPSMCAICAEQDTSALSAPQGDDARLLIEEFQHAWALTLAAVDKVSGRADYEAQRSFVNRMCEESRPLREAIRRAALSEAAKGEKKS